MDDPKAVVLDISSDEEPGFDLCGGGDTGDGDEFNFISELFGEDKEKFDNIDKGECDDVVVVGEVFANRKLRIIMSSNSVCKGGGIHDEDDDCVILDGDPGKPVAVANEKEENDDNDSDELVVISEKGEVACRDFPHPRHLCVKFPFATSPHENYCDQCHCYVCDSLAPCVDWGTGLSSIDHCHATDKEQFWKAQRKSSMRSDKARPGFPALAGGALSMRPPMMNQPSSLASNLVQQNQVSGRSTIRPCSLSTSNGMLQVTREGRTQHSGYAIPRSRFPPNSVSQPLRTASNYLRDRRQNNGNISPQFSSPRMAFKRTTHLFGHTSAANRSGYRPSDPRNSAATMRLQGFRGGQVSVPVPVRDAYRGPYLPTQPMSPHTELPTHPVLPPTDFPTQPIVGNGFSNYLPPHSQISSNQNVSSGYADYLPPHPQLSSQQYMTCEYPNSVPQTSSQQQYADVFGNLLPPQPQGPSGQHVGGNFGYSSPSQPQVATHSPVSNAPLVPPQQYAKRSFEHPGHSRPQASWQLEVGDAFQYQAPSQSMPSSIVHTKSNLGDPPLSHQHQMNNLTSVPVGGPSNVEQANQTTDALGLNSAVSDFGWLAHSPSNDQPSIDNFQIQRAGQTNNHAAGGSQSPGSRDFAPSDLQFDNWFFEQENFSVPPGLRVPSPEPRSADNLFFDF